MPRYNSINERSSLRERLIYGYQTVGPVCVDAPRRAHSLAEKPVNALKIRSKYYTIVLQCCVLLWIPYEER